MMAGARRGPHPDGDATLRHVAPFASAVASALPTRTTEGTVLAWRAVFLQLDAPGSAAVLNADVVSDSPFFNKTTSFT